MNNQFANEWIAKQQTLGQVYSLRVTNQEGKTFSGYTASIKKYSKDFISNNMSLEEKNIAANLFCNSLNNKITMKAKL